MMQTETPADEPAHDVLAAEAFAMPARDPALSHGPVDLPDDPTGIQEPHDVLAAEEFAMPAGRQSRAGAALTHHAKSSWRIGLSAALCAATTLVAVRVLRRR
jgi:hypothetical protein